MLQQRAGIKIARSMNIHVCLDEKGVLQLEQWEMNSRTGIIANTSSFSPIV